MSPIAFRFLNKNILSHINLQKDFNMNEISSLLTLFNGKDSSLRILFSNFTIHPISLSNKSYDETNYLQQQDNNYINLEDNNIIVTKEKQCESVFEFQSINKLLIKELNFTFHYRITKVKFKKSKEIKLEKLWDEGTFQLFNVTILFEWNIISLLQNTLNISNYNLFIQQLDNNNISNKTDDFIKKIEISNSLQTNFKSNFIGNYLSKQVSNIITNFAFPVMKSQIESNAIHITNNLIISQIVPLLRVIFLLIILLGLLILNYFIF